MRRRVKGLFNSKGMSLVEALVATSLLAIVSVSVVRGLVQTKAGSKRLASSSQCQQVAQAVLLRARGQTGKTEIDDPHDEMAGLIQSHPERFGMGFNMDLDNNVTPNETNAWLLINNSINHLLALYNTDLAYCSNNQPNYEQGTGMGKELRPGQTLPNWQKAIVPSDVQLHQQRTFLKIKRIDLGGNAGNMERSDCLQSGAGTLRIVPTGIDNVNEPYVDVGLEVSVSVTYQDNNGVIRGCQARTTMKYDADTTPPPINAASTAVDPTSPGYVGPDIICDRTSVSDDIYFNEKGVQLACNLGYGGGTRLTNTDPSGAFGACTGSIGGADFTLSRAPDLVPPPIGGYTGYHVNISGLNEGWYRHYTRGFDTAQNQSETRGGVDFGIDLSRPSIGSLSSGQVQPSASRFVGGQFQCTGGPVTWTASIVQSMAVSPAGANFSFMAPGGLQKVDAAGNIQTTGLGGGGNPGSCSSPTGTSGNVAGSGQLSVTVTACDSCGTGGSATETWFADLEIPNGAVVGGGGVRIFDNVPVVFSLLPAKQTNVPWAYDCGGGEGATTCEAPASKPCENGRFMATAHDGCGRTDPTELVIYHVRPGPGDPCRSSGIMGCPGGYVCASDAGGTCQPQGRTCRRSSECGACSCHGYSYNPGNPATIPPTPPSETLGRCCRGGGSSPIPRCGTPP